jgi:hypothetical protein
MTAAPSNPYSSIHSQLTHFSNPPSLPHSFLPPPPGPHPGTTQAEVVQNLTPLLQAGVTTFVCVQQELPSPLTAAASQARSSYGGANVVSARPYLRDAQALVDAGGLPQSGSSSPLSFVHAPIPAGGPMILEDAQLRQLVLDCVGYMRAGEYLYLQCGDGNGRSGTVAAVLLGLAFNLGPVEAMALMQKSRADRFGAQGPAPETHEQRMQVHRLLSDKTLRTAAAAVAPRHSDPLTTEANSRVAGILAKIRGIAGKKGPASLIYLKRYAAKLAGTASSTFGNVVVGSLNRAGFDKLCADAEWFVTPEEGQTLWDAAVAATRTSAAAAATTPPGAVDITSLFRLICGPLQPRRAATVHDAFSRLSSGRDAVLLDRLASAFQAAQHPDVKANRRKLEDVTSEFLDTFGVQARTERGATAGSLRTVSAVDFEDYYADISACIADDAYFDLVVFGCWPSSATAGVEGFAGGPRARESKANPKITAPVGGGGGPGAHGSGGPGSSSGDGKPSIFAALQHSQARSTTEAGYSYLERSDMATALAALRIHLARVGGFAVPYLAAMLRRYDADKDGMIDALELRLALRDTVLSCAHDAGPGARARAAAAASGAAMSAAAAAGGMAAGPGATGGPDHPLLIADVDTDAVFTAVALKFTPRSLDTQRPLIPLEAFHSALRGSLSEARRSAVLSIFTALDKGGQGALPISAILLAFRAEEHPAVAAGRASVPSLIRQFQDSFGEGFGYVDKFGPSLRMRPGPGGEAYSGHGDGLVRLTFFEAFFEGLGAQYPDDAEFNLVLFHIMGGGAASGSRVKGRLGGASASAASFDPRAMAARAEDGEDGLLMSMSKLGMGRGANASSTNANPHAASAAAAAARVGPNGMHLQGQGNPPSPRSAAATLEREGFSRSMSGLLPGPASAHSAGNQRGSGLAQMGSGGGGGGGAPGTPVRGGGRRRGCGGGRVWGRKRLLRLRPRRRQHRRQPGGAVHGLRVPHARAPLDPRRRVRRRPRSHPRHAAAPRRQGRNEARQVLRAGRGGARRAHPAARLPRRRPRQQPRREPAADGRAPLPPRPVPLRVREPARLCGRPLRPLARGARRGRPRGLRPRPPPRVRRGRPGRRGRAGPGA